MPMIGDGMLNLFDSGNELLIWLGSISAGLAVVAQIIRWSLERFDFDDQGRLCGNWIGYGYFHSEFGERFYRETIKVSRRTVVPWKLKMDATPCSTGKPDTYSGPFWRQGDYIYSMTRQGNRHDPCFEIGMLRLSADHIQDKIVGIHLGQSYVTQVHVATSFVWSRTPLDPHGSLTSDSPSDIEQRQFFELCSRYFVMKSEFFELQLGYKPQV